MAVRFHARFAAPGGSLAAPNGTRMAVRMAVSRLGHSPRACRATVGFAVSLWPSANRERRTRGSVTQVAWETRRGGTRRYYTRSVRREGRVVRQYVGTGPHAEAVAAADRERCVNREARRAAARSTLGRIAEADAKVKALCDTAEVAARAHLLMVGYHRHARGSWRRRRV